jgi:hypothetical protein
VQQEITVEKWILRVLETAYSKIVPKTFITDRSKKEASVKK